MSALTTRIIEMGSFAATLFARPRSKREIKKRLTFLSGASNFGGACGGRTHDKRIKSPLLYQLS